MQMKYDICFWKWADHFMSMEYKYSNLSLSDGAKAWLVMTYNDSVRQDHVFSIQVMITTRWRSLLSGLYMVIFDDMSWHNYYDVANMIQNGRYLNLPNTLWGLLGPQRTKIVHIFVISHTLQFCHMEDPLTFGVWKDPTTC